MANNMIASNSYFVSIKTFIRRFALTFSFSFNVSIVAETSSLNPHRKEFRTKSQQSAFHINQCSLNAPNHLTVRLWLSLVQTIPFKVIFDWYSSFMVFRSSSIQQHEHWTRNMNHNSNNNHNLQGRPSTYLERIQLVRFSAKTHIYL